MKLFDLDGTLIDSNCVWREIDAQFLSAHNLQSTDEYLYVVGHSIFPTAAQFTKEYYHLDLTPQEIMDEWFSLAHEAYEHHIPLKPFAKEYLMQEIAKGEHLALVSACVPALGHAVLERHGLTPLFDKIIFAQEYGLEKRDPRFYDQVLALLDITAKDCVFYDDAPVNCTAAKKAGMNVIGVYDALYDDQQNEMQCICDQYIDNFQTLLD